MPRRSRRRTAPRPGRRRSRAPGRCCRARTSGRCCRCTPSRRATGARRRRGSSRRAGRCGTGRSRSGWTSSAASIRGIMAEMLAIAGRDGDRPLVDERQVSLGDAEHVEVVPKARTGMELPEGRRDPRRHPCRPQTPRSTSSGHRATRARRRPTRARVCDDPRRDAGRRRRDRVVDLVPAVDGEQLRVRAGDPHEERRPVHDDPPVRVGQPGRDPLGGDDAPGPVRDRRDDLLDRGDGHGRVSRAAVAASSRPATPGSAPSSSRVD